MATFNFFNYYLVKAGDGQTAAERFDAMDKDARSFYLVGSDLYLGSTKITNGADLNTAVSNIATNAADIAIINTTRTIK